MNKILCIDMGVCSAWGRKFPKHIFYTQYAQKIGHHYCVNCGIPKKEAREEERFEQTNLIETRIFDMHSDLENPIWLKT